MDKDKSIREALGEQGSRLDRYQNVASLDISGVYNRLRGKHPVRYEHLQFSLENIFETLPNEQQREGAFTMIQHLNAYLWKVWFELHFPLDMRSVIKTIDDAYTTMCEYMPETEDETLDVVEFQVQTKESPESLFERLQSVDTCVPVPEPLEGGDGKGPLYQCIFQKEKFKNLIELYPSLTIYTQPHEFTMNRLMYTSSHKVSWQMGGHPTTEPIGEW
jgi:hypothetical protein